MMTELATWLMESIVDHELWTTGVDGELLHQGAGSISDCALCLMIVRAVRRDGELTDDEFAAQAAAYVTSLIEKQGLRSGHGREQ